MGTSLSAQCPPIEIDLLKFSKSQPLLLLLRRWEKIISVNLFEVEIHPLLSPYINGVKIVWIFGSLKIGICLKFRICDL